MRILQLILCFYNFAKNFSSNKTLQWDQRKEKKIRILLKYEIRSLKGLEVNLGSMKLDKIFVKSSIFNPLKWTFKMKSGVDLWQQLVSLLLAWNPSLNSENLVPIFGDVRHGSFLVLIFFAKASMFDADLCKHLAHWSSSFQLLMCCFTLFAVWNVHCTSNIKTT